MEPCGMQDYRMAVSERSLPTAIYCDRSVTNDCNQSRAVSLTPNSACARLQTTPLSGMVCHSLASTCCSQPKPLPVVNYS